MFPAVHSSSSGALTVFAASGLHTHVVTGRSQVWVGTGWAVCRSKHVEPLMNGGIINSVTRLHLVGYFYWIILRCTDPWILNPQIYIFIKIRPVETEFFYADRQTLRSYFVAFRNAAKAPNDTKTDLTKYDTVNPLCSIRGREFLDYLTVYPLLKMESIRRSSSNTISISRPNVKCKTHRTMPSNSASVKVIWLRSKFNHSQVPAWRDFTFLTSALQRTVPSKYQCLSIQRDAAGDNHQNTMAVSCRNFHKTTPTWPCPVIPNGPSPYGLSLLPRLRRVQLMASSCFHTSSKPRPCPLACNKRKARVHVWAHFEAKRGNEKIQVWSRSSGMLGCVGW